MNSDTSTNVSFATQTMVDHGDINIIQSITLGDLLISTLLAFLIIAFVLDMLRR